MDRTNANDFRANLKEWLDAASVEPIKITRKNGDAFVLIKAEEFEKMQLELTHLQGLAKGLIDLTQGRIQRADDASLNAIFSSAKGKALSRRKTKKAVG